MPPTERHALYDRTMDAVLARAERAEAREGVLRTENDELRARAAVVEDAWAEVIQREQRGDNAHFYDMNELRAELAAERAQHETTRAALAALPGQPVYDVVKRTVQFGEANKITREIGELINAALAAASPSPSDDDVSSSSPVAGQEAGT